MESRIKIAGHPLHPMLIVFPLGLLATAVAFDIAALVSSDNGWFNISFWIMAAGILGGLLAALPGLIDWVAIPSNTPCEDHRIVARGRQRRCVGAVRHQLVLTAWKRWSAQQWSARIIVSCPRPCSDHWLARGRIGRSFGHGQRCSSECAEFTV